MYLARALYRVRQFLRGLTAKVEAHERTQVVAVLGPHQHLFYAMTRRDQRHCLDVFQRLRRRGCADGPLLVAALLHDIGKGNVRLWHRAVYVLLAAASPGLAEALTNGEGSGWHSALAALREHPQRGAALAAAASLSPEVVELIRRHEEDGEDSLVVQLRIADESC